MTTVGRWVKPRWFRWQSNTDDWNLESSIMCVTFSSCASACCHNMPTSSKEILSSYCHAWWVRVRACLFAWMEVKLEKVSNTTSGHRIKSLLSVLALNCTQVHNKGLMPPNWLSTLYCINFNLIWSKKEEQTGNSLKTGSTYKSVYQLVQAAGRAQLSTPITLKSEICLWVNGTHKCFPFSDRAR